MNLYIYDDLDQCNLGSRNTTQAVVRALQLLSFLSYPKNSQISRALCIYGCITISSLCVRLYTVYNLIKTSFV